MGTVITVAIPFLTVLHRVTGSAGYRRFVVTPRPDALCQKVWHEPLMCQRVPDEKVETLGDDLRDGAHSSELLAWHAGSARLAVSSRLSNASVLR